MVKINNDHLPKSFTIDYEIVINAIICPVGITPLKNLNDIAEEEIIHFNALWDTGASNSVVTKETARRLGLVSIGKANVHHAGGDSETNVFLVQLFLPNRITLSVRVTECDNSTQFGLIIGMDVICRGDFSITNVNKKTTVSFRIPSIEKVDFVNPVVKPEIILPMAKRQDRNKQCVCGSGKKYKNCCGKGMY